MASNKKCENCHFHVPITLRDFFWQDPFFSSNWDGFTDLHSKMIEETKQLWDKFDQQLKDLECADETTAKDQPTEGANEPAANDASKDSVESGLWLFPRRLMRLPSLFSGESSKDLILKNDETMIKIRDDDSVFEVSLNTQNYRPDEIRVNVVDNVLNIEGKHEENSEDSNKFTSRQFFRRYALPKECPADKVVSNLSADGVLLVTAPKLAITAEKK